MTLVEMVISIAIISLLAGSAIVSFSIQRQPRMDTTARNLIADIRWACSMAEHTNQNYAVNLTPTATPPPLAPVEYRIYKTPNGNTGDFTLANLVKRVVVETNLALSGANLWISAPTAHMSGLSVITLQYEDRAKRILIFNETGYVRLDE